MLSWHLLSSDQLVDPVFVPIIMKAGEDEQIGTIERELCAKYSKKCRFSLGLKFDTRARTRNEREVSVIQPTIIRVQLCLSPTLIRSSQITLNF